MEDPAARTLMAYSLAHLDSPPEGTADALEGLLGDPDPDVRRMALMSLGRAGGDRPGTIDRAREWLDSDDHETTLAAWTALEAIDPNNPDLDKAWSAMLDRALGPADETAQGGWSLTMAVQATSAVATHRPAFLRQLATIAATPGVRRGLEDPRSCAGEDPPEDPPERAGLAAEVAEACRFGEIDRDELVPALVSRARDPGDRGRQEVIGLLVRSGWGTRPFSMLFSICSASRRGRSERPRSERWASCGGSRVRG